MRVTTATFHRSRSAAAAVLLGASVLTIGFAFVPSAADASPASAPLGQWRRLDATGAGCCDQAAAWRRTLAELLDAAATVVQADVAARHVAEATVAIDLADMSRRAADARRRTEAAAPGDPVGTEPPAVAAFDRQAGRVAVPAGGPTSAPVATPAPAGPTPAPASPPATVAPAPQPAPAPPQPAPAQPSAGALESTFLSLVNGERAAAGLAPLAYDGGLAALARAQAGAINAAGSLFHQSLGNVLATGWHTAGENVGYGASASGLHGALVASAAHYANMVNPSFTGVGIGVVVGADGQIWVAEVFAG